VVVLRFDAVCSDVVGGVIRRAEEESGTHNAFAAGLATRAQHSTNNAHSTVHTQQQQQHAALRAHLVRAKVDVARVQDDVVVRVAVPLAELLLRRKAWFVVVVVGEERKQPACAQQNLGAGSSGQHITLEQKHTLARRLAPPAFAWRLINGP
jgi:hypothetical protein